MSDAEGICSAARKRFIKQQLVMQMHWLSLMWGFPNVDNALKRCYFTILRDLSEELISPARSGQDSKSV